MTVVSRESVLQVVAQRIPRSAPSVLVAVDGVDGSGKTTFAGALIDVLRARGRDAWSVHADDFLHLRAVRHRRGLDSPEGFWLDSYDLDALRRLVLEPVRRSPPSWCGAATDPVRDLKLPEDWTTAEPGVVVVVDGLFLHRDELVDRWDTSVFLRAPVATTVARVAARDGSPSDPGDPRNRRYVEGQRLYLQACDPERRADLVIDNTDVERPVIVEA